MRNTDSEGERDYLEEADQYVELDTLAELYRWHDEEIFALTEEALAGNDATWDHLLTLSSLFRGRRIWAKD